MALRTIAVWCPGWSAAAGDPDHDARVFEPVVAAVEALAPGVEVVRPGLVAVPARGPTRYFGSELVVAERIVDLVAAQARMQCQVAVQCQVGVADGLFAATLAAHRGLLVPPGESAGFLAPLGIGELHHSAAGFDRAGDGRAGDGRVALVDLLHRLGLRSLGAFAALPVDDVASRFGPVGVRASRLARGLDERPVARRRPPADGAGAGARRLDPPVHPVDAVAFASREPAERRAAAQQRGLWGEPGEDDERAGRALARVQGMLGADAVLTGVLGGGRDPADRIRLVPWGQDPVPARTVQDRRAGSSTATVNPRASSDTCGDRPWPGRLPAPSPSRVPTRPLPAEVLDDAGRLVAMSGRGVLTAIPYRVAVDGHPPRRVLSWAGPWPIEERWWEPDGGRCYARLHAVLDAEPGPGRAGGEPLAVLLGCDTDRWRVEGIYE